jgi:ethylmalonyl-CoA mutase
LKVDPLVEAETIASVIEWKVARDNVSVTTAIGRVKQAAEDGSNIMEPSIALARAGGTTGEWANALREVFGEFRAPTGVGSGGLVTSVGLAEVAQRSKALKGGPPRFLVAKPGLDGHSNGAEQIAVAARDAGMEVIYQGIRLTPEQIAASVRDEDPDVLGLSILSGSHLHLVPEIVNRLRAYGLDTPVVVGGIIPEDDRATLTNGGVARVYTPKDFDMTRIMHDIVDLTVTARS